MKSRSSLLPAVAFLAATLVAGFAGTPILHTAAEGKKAVVEPVPDDPRFLYRITSSYVFESDFERGDDASGDALNNEFEFGYRIPIDLAWAPRDDGRWYLRLGARYTRFDFNNDGGLPIPNTLQSAAGVIGIEYLVKGETGFVIQTRPGVYFEHDVSADNFDAPITAGFAFTINDSLYGVAGVSFSLLRNYPIIPSVGVVWRANPEWTVYAYLPEPRIVYRPSENCAFFVGGELNGGSFRVDGGTGRREDHLDRAVVTYSEYRVGGGYAWSDANCSFEIGGGYAFQRKFDYWRAEKGYETDEGAPYVRAEFRASF